MCKVAKSGHSCPRAPRRQQQHWHPGNAHSSTSGDTYSNWHLLFSLQNCPSSFFWFFCEAGETRSFMITSSICSNFTSQDLPGLCFPWSRVYFPFCHFRLSSTLREHSSINCNETSAGEKGFKGHKETESTVFLYEKWIGHFACFKNHSNIMNLFVQF